MKRPVPVALLLVATAVVIVMDAAIIAIPRVLAAPQPAATASPSALVAVASPSPDSLADGLVPTIVDPTPSPSPKPSATPTPTPTPTPVIVKAKPTPRPRVTPRVTPHYADTVTGARQYVRHRIGASGYYCINKIWTGESHWNPRAGSVGKAYGIPQAFPGRKMAAFGANWRTSPLTQVKWGLWYVSDRYGSACAAYSFWHKHGWY